LVMTRRNLTKYIRLPQLVVFSTIQPIMFVLMFSYVFGGAIQIPGQSYISYLIPGIIVQTVLFGAMITGLGLAEDVSRGMIDRFRSLPMSRGAVLAGRTIADLIRNIFVILLMFGVGYLIGFRFQGSFGDSMAAFVLALLFGFAFSWISAAIGMAVKNVETAQSAGFIWIFPLAFISSIFVPIETMNKYLKGFADINPVTYTVNAVRALSLNQPVGDNIIYALIWIAAILTVFIPIAIRSYRRLS